MIPKIIHYCWFGRNPLPELEQRCIASWRKFFPDYELIEWNEDNFDVQSNTYVKEAYEAKKWAFVSDYVRFKALYQYGGIYLDTDVEIIESLTDLIEKGPFMGLEKQCDKKRITYSVAPGLIICAEPEMCFFKKVIDQYDSTSFFNADGSPNLTTVVDRITSMLENDGFKREPVIQTIAGITIYPDDFFSPMDFKTGVISITENTRSIHHYAASWHSKDESTLRKRKYQFIKLLGPERGSFVAKCYSLLYNLLIRLKDKGLKNTVHYYYHSASNLFLNKGSQ